MNRDTEVSTRTHFHIRWQSGEFDWEAYSTRVETEMSAERLSRPEEMYTRKMPKKGHKEEQIVAVLRQVEAGARVAEVCRKGGHQRGDVLSLEVAVFRSGRERAA